MEQFTIEVARENAKEARKKGKLAIIYYGKGVEPISFSTDYQDFRRTYKKAGKSSIIVMIDEKKGEFPVLVHEIQYDAVTDEMIHVDMVAVNLKNKITTDIPLVFVGQAPAVKELGGTLMHNKETVHVECLPNDLVHEIQVGINTLIDFHSVITVGDIEAPKGITILDAEDVNIASVSAPRKEEEEKPAESEEKAEETKEEKKEA